MVQSFRRRAAAGFCAAALMAALVAHPLQARAASVAAGALAAVGFGTIVCAYLNASGVFPYNAVSGDNVQLDFSRWTTDNLQALVDRYNATNPALPLTPQTVKAYSVGATICVVHNAWSALRAFVQWLQSEFSLVDNQTGAVLGALQVPYTFPYYGGSDNAGIRANGVYLGHNSAGGSWYGATPMQGASVFYCVVSSEPTYILISPAAAGGTFGYLASQNGVVTALPGSTSASVTYDGVVYRYYQAGTWSDMRGLSFSSVADAIAYALGQDVELQGVIADTAAISIPGALPEGAEFGGLQVAELGAGATAGALEDAIASGVTERQQPIVRPVEVEVQQGLDVDASTGEIAENPVVIAPTDIPLVASDYSIPGLSSVFPFSVPWDIMRVFQALDAEPTNPLDGVSLTLDIPWLFGDSPPVVEFGLGAFPAAVADKMDDVLAMFRAFSLVIACLAWLIFISGFIRF